MAQVTVGNAIGHGAGKLSAPNLEHEPALEFAETIRNEYLVEISPEAPGCCIDGRCALHTMAGEGTELELGPHIAGGPLLTVFGAAELVPGYFDEGSSPTVLGRLAELERILLGAQDAPFKLGAHIAESAARNGFINPENGAPQTGCGLNDKFKEVVAMAATGSSEKPFIDQQTQGLLGESFDENATQYRSAEDVTGRVKEYDPAVILNKALLKEDGSGADKVEVLMGEHGEELVVFNNLENTTVDRDRLVRETGRQVFVVDMWYINKLAHAMSQGRPDAPEMYQKLRHAMTAFQVATYLALCDGSHRTALFGQPQSQHAAALAG